MQELNFEKNFPIVSSGIISLEIKHMLVIPIIYNNEVIAIIELGGLDKPSQEVKNYILKDSRTACHWIDKCLCICSA